MAVHIMQKQEDGQNRCLGETRREERKGRRGREKEMRKENVWEKRS